MEAQLVLWQARVVELTARAERRGPEGDFASLQRIDELKVKCALTQSRIDKIKMARP